MIDNVCITIDSEYGYHVYIYYTSLTVGKHNENCVYDWYSSDDIEHIFVEIIKKLNELKKEI